MGLETLPYDILFNIVRLLDVEDLVIFGKTCTLFSGEESLCRIVAEVRHSIRSLASIPRLSSDFILPRGTPRTPSRPVSRARKKSPMQMQLLASAIGDRHWQRECQPVQRALVP